MQTPPIKSFQTGRIIPSLLLKPTSSQKKSGNQSVPHEVRSEVKSSPRTDFTPLEVAKQLYSTPPGLLSSPLTIPPDKLDPAKFSLDRNLRQKFSRSIPEDTTKVIAAQQVPESQAIGKLPIFPLTNDVLQAILDPETLQEKVYTYTPAENYSDKFSASVVRILQLGSDGWNLKNLDGVDLTNLLKGLLNRELPAYNTHPEKAEEDRKELAILRKIEGQATQSRASMIKDRYNTAGIKLELADLELESTGKGSDTLEAKIKRRIRELIQSNRLPDTLEAKIKRRINQLIQNDRLREAEKNGTLTFRNELNVKGVTLINATLSGLNLVGANFEGTDCTNAKLIGVNLSGANVHNANFSEANLQEANLTNIRVHNAPGDQSQKANFSGADLTNATIGDTTWLQHINFNNATMNAIKANEIYFDHSSFVKAKLEGASLIEAHFFKGNLTDADLSRANLAGASLTNANLSRANLRSALLAEASLVGANLTAADLNYANLTSANLTSANLTGVNLTGANLTGADLTDANLKGAIGANLAGSLDRRRLPLDEKLKKAEELIDQEPGLPPEEVAARICLLEAQVEELMRARRQSEKPDDSLETQRLALESLI